MIRVLSLNVDAGGTTVLSRSCLRTLLILSCLIGILLPLNPSKVSTGWRSFPWFGLWLLAGLLSAGYSQAPILAQAEWETWALMVLWGGLLVRLRPKALPVVCLVAFYISSLGLGFQALLKPSGLTRLEGAFQNANAFSSYLVLTIPFLFWRYEKAGKDRFLALGLAALFLVLQLWTGSLTGFCIVVGFAVGTLVPSKWSWPLAIMVGIVPLILNLWLSPGAALGLPLIFVGLVCWKAVSWVKVGQFRPALLFVLVMLCSNWWLVWRTLPSRAEGISATRLNSGLARLDFYQASTEMFRGRPLLGLGPQGFGRRYPAFQKSLGYYSKVVHSLPLEALVEWGIVGVVLLGMGLWSNYARFEPGQEMSKVFLSSTALLGLHSLSGVESQFPYLVILVVVMWVQPSGTQEDDPVGPLGLNWVEATTRILLALVLVCLLALNALRIAGKLQSTFATELQRNFPQSSQSAVEAVLLGGLRSNPLDGEIALLLGDFYLQTGAYRMAGALGHHAGLTDSLWVAPQVLQMKARTISLTPTLVEDVLANDPINYPCLYQYLAEALVANKRPADALAVLREQQSRYDHRALMAVAETRRPQLYEQLTTFWMLVAVLEENVGDPHLSESAFRKALFYAERRLSRLREIEQYSLRSGLTMGPIVADLVDQVSSQIPARAP